MLHGECARKYENWISNVIFNTFLEWNWLFLDNSMHYHFPHSKRHINQCLTNFISLKTFLSWFSECIDLYFITFLSSQCFFNFFISLNTLHKTSSINCSMEKKTPKNEHKKKLFTDPEIDESLAFCESKNHWSCDGLNASFIHAHLPKLFGAEPTNTV